MTKLESPSLLVRFRAAPPRLLWGSALGMAVYLALMGTNFGLRPEQLGFAALVLFVSVWSEATRRFYRSVLPFVILAVIYDSSRLLQPLLKVLAVHVKEPYAFDKRFFPIDSALGVLTPNEFFLHHHWPWVDLVTGTAYILFLYEVLGFGLYLALFRRDERGRSLLARFGWTFLAVNVMGIATYYLYPAAPPWYVQLHGFGPADLSTLPNPAAAARWDDLTGIAYFRHFYARGASVFGAIPSLHAAYPLVVFFYARALGRAWLTVATFAFFLLVCFSAVYLQHHYILDVGLGAEYALVACLVERAVSCQKASASRVAIA